MILFLEMKLDAIDAVMLDLDGTLVDTVADLTAALNRMLEERDLAPVEYDTVAMLIGQGAAHIVGAVLGERGAATDADSVHLARRSYLAHYAALNGRYSRVYPGVTEGLEGMARRGLRLACVTNKPTALAAALLRDKGLDRFFAQVLGGDRFERLKPDPLPLLQTCAALGSGAARTLMVGDSSNDALAARAAGCPVVLVTYGYNHGQPVRKLNADGFVDSLAELAA